MTEEFLGRGWSITLNVDGNSQIAMSEYEKDIEEAILIILNTAKGERIMHPDFGCKIHEITFTIVNTATLSLMEHHIREALTQWEPRIEIRAVKTSIEKIDQGILLIEIIYKIRATNTIYNLVYPFYVRGGE